MKKLLLPLLIIGLVFSSCEKEDLSSVTELNAVAGKAKKRQTFDPFAECIDANTTSNAKLYAGQNEHVGFVTVQTNPDNNLEYIITYDLFAGWCLKETHLSVVNDPEDFQTNNGGNPQIGRFEYQRAYDCALGDSYIVPKDEGPYIAAHAVVNCVDSNEIELPETIDFCTVANGGTGAGDDFVADPLFGPYLEVKLDLDGDTTDEHFNAWCIDVLGSIGVPQCVEGALVYSSLGDYPTDRFPNINKVNWLLNNLENIIGETSSGAGGTYNYGDVQNAIWLLINEIPCQSCVGLGNYDATFGRAEEVVAMTNGQEDYIPGCDEYYGVLIVPTDSNIQPIIIRIPLDCNEGDCEETAWARNEDETNCGNFPGGSWATFFKTAE